MNQKELIKLLERKDKNIQEVLGKMEILAKTFSKTKKHSGFVPFLKTYAIVTRNVAEKYLSKNNYYQNPKEIENLDIYFAKLYFQPLAKFIQSKNQHPWENYYSHCKKEGEAFLQMFLGIHVHVNGDLPIALAKTNYKSKKDFKKINKILHESIKEVFQFLFINKKDIIGLTGLIFQRRLKKEFNKTIVKWRNQAWTNYKAIKKDPSKVKELKNKTELMSKEIIEILSNINLKTLKKIRKLKIKLK